MPWPHGSADRVGRSAASTKGMCNLTCGRQKERCPLDKSHAELKSKGKSCVPVLSSARHKDVWWSGIIVPRVLNLGTRREWSASRAGRFTVEYRATGTHWIGGWVGPRAGLDAVQEAGLPVCAWTRTPVVQTIASYYSGSLQRCLYFFVRNILDTSFIAVKFKPPPVCHIIINITCTKFCGK
jgi:hypothetical protein